jgi:hypothetical protein
MRLADYVGSLREGRGKTRYLQGYLRVRGPD